MIIAVGVVSPNEAWGLPRRFVDDLRREVSPHQFVEASDREALPQILPQADAAFAAFVDRDVIPSLLRLKWVQAPAAGVGHILSSEFIASPIVLTSARGVRARPIAEHVMAVTLALARQLHLVVRRQSAHQW